MDLDGGHELVEDGRSLLPVLWPQPHKRLKGEVRDLISQALISRLPEDLLLGMGLLLEREDLIVRFNELG